MIGHVSAQQLLIPENADLWVPFPEHCHMSIRHVYDLPIHKNLLPDYCAMMMRNCKLCPDVDCLDDDYHYYQLDHLNLR